MADLLKRLDALGYRMCYGGRLAFLWSRIWYRYRCPYPVMSNHSARACVLAGHCGCNNYPRYALPSTNGNTL